jgi:hypothetical protein
MTGTMMLTRLCPSMGEAPFEGGGFGESCVHQRARANDHLQVEAAPVPSSKE